MMRRIALVPTLMLALAGAAAFAAEPEVIAEADLLRVQLAQARVELAAHALDDAKRAAEEAVAGLKGRYRIGDADQIDAKTREIKRAKPTK
jgi:hypothetical protein